MGEWGRGGVGEGRSEGRSGGGVGEGWSEGRGRSGRGRIWMRWGKKGEGKGRKFAILRLCSFRRASHEATNEGSWEVFEVRKSFSKHKLSR